MITWTFKAPTGVYDANLALSGIVDKGDYAGATAKRFVQTHNDEKIVFAGNFTVAGGEPTGGTITGLKVYNDGVLLLEISGISVGVKAYKDLRETFTDESEVIDLFRNGPTKMLGTGGADDLIGGQSADRLFGKGGADDLTGRGGADKFVFTTALGGGVDTIHDFSHAADSILLNHTVFAKLNDSGQVKAGFFHVGTAAADGNDFLIYDKTTGNLYYDRDGDGAKAQVLFATLANKPQDVAANDFFMI